jgi:dTDP-4-dehydrorhamnose reductase
MRILVFGYKGQLGRDLIAVFGRDGETVGYDLPELDITDPGAVNAAVSGFKPDVVVNAAAYTDVEGAEDHRALAFAVNETGARHVAGAAARAGAAILYYGTDFVFDGATQTPYEPDDAPAPLSVYGESKWAGERATIAANPRHFIVRTAWLYGPGGNNFVEKILRAAASRPELKVVEDEVGSPTYTRDLAEISCALCTTAAYGTYHAVNAGACSRFEFARAILSLAGTTTRVRPCTRQEFPTKAQRPLYSVLSNAKIEAVTGRTMRPWEDALQDYLRRREETA